MDENNHYFRMSRTDSEGRRYLYNDVGLMPVTGFVAHPDGTSGKVRTESGDFDYLVFGGRLVIVG